MSSEQEDIKEIVKQFCDQCCWIRTVYNEYCILYEGGEKRLELLNKTARTFFSYIQLILIDYIFLNICKLTDSAYSRKGGNLTIKYILEQIDSEIQKHLGLKKLSDRIHKFRDKIEPARNKIIAHFDVKTTISNQTLGVVSKDDNEQFWKDLQEFVNKIHSHYLDEIFPLDAIVYYDAKDLIWALKQAAYFDQHFTNVVHSNLFKDEKFLYKDA
ncbi:MAG: hypothetical protein JW804_03330 [Sedimentisphaerales bacterium]|nr:hypothetical protein [Sedimentisphaerales bacterium]